MKILLLAAAVTLIPQCDSDKGKHQDGESHGEHDDHKGHRHQEHEDHKGHDPAANEEQKK